MTHQVVGDKLGSLIWFPVDGSSCRRPHPDPEPVMSATESTPRVFLTAAWRSLLVLNYEVDRRLLDPWVPAGTELDLWQDRALVSVVGFRFLGTRLLGWPIPFHRDFDEVNLRFYVRRWHHGAWRRGVVFIREVVPKLAVACVANWVYHEHYVRRTMRHEVVLPQTSNDVGRVSYGVQEADRWLTLSVTITGDAQPLIAGSEAEFILEHYWGYTRQPDGSTQEYQVEHPSWRVWSTNNARFEGDATNLYGADFARLLRSPPCSSFVAEGSAVTVRAGRPVILSERATSTV
jgi:uncharacterized protein YqjF (DUF2071 family)